MVVRFNGRSIIAFWMFLGLADDQETFPWLIVGDALKIAVLAILFHQDVRWVANG